MPYRVLLTDSAARDIEELDAYITLNDSSASAEQVLTKIEKTLTVWRNSPNVVFTLVNFPLSVFANIVKFSSNLIESYIALSKTRYTFTLSWTAGVICRRCLTGGYWISNRRTQGLEDNSVNG